MKMTPAVSSSKDTEVILFLFLFKYGLEHITFTKSGFNSHIHLVKSPLRAFGEGRQTFCLSHSRGLIRFFLLSV